MIEKIIFADQITDTITYITSPEGIAAIEITSNPGGRERYLVFTDHLGSITTMLRESDGQKFEMSFDAWGNRRNPATWRAYTTTAPEPLFDRGFTGHEHLYAFNLINMNGRVYDPIVGRMLSPDLFIQAPGYSQSLNRYSYCWNNPLRYTDPTGYELGVLYRNDWHWYENPGGFNSSQGIGPGSGNHWSDPHRDVYGNFMLMSSSTFQSNYGISNDGYNNIIKNFSDFVKSRGNLITRSDGRSGYYAENSSATRTSYDAYYDHNNDLIVTEVWEVVSPWVNVGRRVSGGGDIGGLPELSPGAERGIGLGGSLWGGAATMTYADELAIGISTTAKGMIYLRVGGNVLGGLGFVATSYNNVVKIQDGTLNTADIFDWSISGGMLVTGLLMTNPIGLTVLAVGGLGYGIYRLGAGDTVDAIINERFGFRP